jgi:hypothetical protein
MDRPSNEPDKSPLTQDDQPNTGSVGGSQGYGKPDRARSLPRGSEPETRGTSRGR